MTKKTEIVFVKSIKEGVDSSDFFTRAIATPELSKDFLFYKTDATSIRDVLRDWIVENGISSLFNYHITCDSIMHPGFKIDEIENLILGFISRLNGAKHLFIIDPYFYSREAPVVALFEKMMTNISATLERITVFSKRSPSSERLPMHAVLRKLIPAIQIRDVETNKFHDRFWIDPDNLKGVVMGTSLNGVTKKIALIDNLGRADVTQLSTMARALL
ncbi:hypothetical protein SAMN05216517_10949 [Janthinobacterium sp. OK676]|uniref:hypothetical protein n=1 Tax=Janthinobacterium sp. OK676 TaxID=1855295 RepID=UPI00088073CA|nr:hypothetical protein [Janthinobacterium sp. OK676]SDN22776.1 hypothetical protein SAMN05216517_10949 [Janthinobacterium sp. OK676]